MNEAILEEGERLGISRLCHYTPSRNLIHIASGSDGLLSVAELTRQERREFTPQDRARLDNHPEHISCSIEYPNGWYFRRRQGDTGEARLFSDWVVLGIQPHYLGEEETKFCPRNAAARHGRLVMAGEDTFRSLYAQEVEGAGGETRQRQRTRLRPCPTDDQAEVLIHRQIPLSGIDTIFVRDEEQAQREHARLEQVGAVVESFDFVVAPSFFRAYELSQLIASGDLPNERAWHPRTSNV